MPKTAQRLFKELLQKLYLFCSIKSTELTGLGGGFFLISLDSSKFAKLGSELNLAKLGSSEGCRLIFLGVSGSQNSPSLSGEEL